MHMPGFGAEASLYQTSERYRSVAAGISTPGGQVLPQQSIDFRRPHRPFFTCFFANERCLSRCAGRPIPFDEVCRVGCSIAYDTAVPV